MNPYFAARGITPESYRDFQLPAYLPPLLPADKSAPILDYGCGFGQHLLALKRMGYTCLSGVDLDEEAVRNCLSEGLSVARVGDIREYAASHAGRFEFALMNHVLEHVPKDRIIAWLEQVREMLSRNGRLFLAVPNAQSHTGCYWAFEDFTHSTLFTAGSLLYVLRTAGFDRVEFVDPDCTVGLSPVRRLIKKALLLVYRKNLEFWNRVTSSAFHGPSPAIFSYELKVLAGAGPRERP